RPGLVRDADHVMRVARSFEAVKQDDRRMAGSIRLPVAVREHARILGDVEIARLRFGQPREPPPARPRVQRLPVTAGKERLEGRRRKCHADISAYHPAMDPDLNSTLLHLTRVRLTQDFPAQINACIDVLSDEELW